MFNLFDLVATLRLDSTEYEKGLKASSGLADGIGKKFTALKVAGIAAFGAVSAVAIKFGKDSIQVGMDFDKSMSQVSATMGDSAQEMIKYNGQNMTQIEALTDFAKEMGATTAFSAREASEGLNYMALAGYNAEKSMAMLPNVLNLASAGAMDLGRASDMVTDASSALGLTTEETTELVDKMAKASSKSNTSVEQLGEAILQVGGTAKGMKGGTTELATALGILADNGTKGAEGGTALRNVLLGISSKKFDKTFGELGVSAYDAEGNMRSLKDIFLDMEDAMDGMTQEERTKIISQTFNKQDLKNINALLGTTADRWDELSGAIDDSAGSAQEMAETQLDNLAGDITLFKSALEGAQIALSDKLSPALRDIVQFGTDGLGMLKEAIESPKEAFSKLGDFASDIGNKILEKAKEVAKTLPSTIAKLLATLTGYLRDHSGELVQKGWELILALIKGLLKALPSLIETAGNLVIAIVKGIGTLFGNIIQTGAQLVVKLAQGIWSKSKSFIGDVVSFAKQIPRAIWNAITGLYDIGKNIVSGIWNGISGNLTWLKNLISGWVGNVKSFLKNLFGISSPSKWARDVIGANIVKGLALGLENGEDLVQDSFDSLMPDYDSDYSVNVDRPAIGSSGVQIVNYITVDGAENPEEFTDRFVRRLRLDMRTI